MNEVGPFESASPGPRIIAVSFAVESFGSMGTNWWLFTVGQKRWRMQVRRSSSL